MNIHLDIYCYFDEYYLMMFFMINLVYLVANNVEIKMHNTLILRHLHFFISILGLVRVMVA
jgi:hypothetical protein